MGLEEVGEAYIAKSGKSLLVRFKDPNYNYQRLLCLHRATLKQVLENKRYGVKVMLVTGRQRNRSASSNPDL